jgi:hypothetical protein
MLLLHMQIWRYFNKICDNFFYSQARDNSLYVIYTSTKSYMIAPSYEMSEWVSFWFEWDLGFSECERVLDFDLVRANDRFERWVSVCVRFSGKLLFLRICWNDSLPRNIYISTNRKRNENKRLQGPKMYILNKIQPKCLYQVRAIAVFPVFRLLTDFVCLLTCEFCLSLWKIARCSVILLLPLFK